MFKLTAVTVLAAATALSGAAYAQSVSTRPEQSAMQIAQLLTGQGYRVLEIERDDGRYEVKAINRDGQCVELDVHRRSGDILRTKADDDCSLAADQNRRGRGR